MYKHRILFFHLIPGGNLYDWNKVDKDNLFDNVWLAQLSPQQSNAVARCWIDDKKSKKS